MYYHCFILLFFAVGLIFDDTCALLDLSINLMILLSCGACQSTYDTLVLSMLINMHLYYVLCIGIYFYPSAKRKGHCNHNRCMTCVWCHRASSAPNLACGLKLVAFYGARWSTLWSSFQGRLFWCWATFLAVAGSSYIRVLCQPAGLDFFIRLYLGIGKG